MCLHRVASKSVNWHAIFTPHTCHSPSHQHPHPAFHKRYDQALNRRWKREISGLIERADSHTSGDVKFAVRAKKKYSENDSDENAGNFFREVKVYKRMLEREDTSHE